MLYFEVHIAFLQYFSELIEKLKTHKGSDDDGQGAGEQAGSDED